MKIKQHHFVNNNWVVENSNLKDSKAQLVLVFGAYALIEKTEVYDHLKVLYPNADIIFSSTAGEIMNGEVFDESIVATAIEFEKTKIMSLSTNIAKHENSFEAGKFLYNELSKVGLSSIFVISDGTIINGDELVEGLKSNNSNHIPITGGLAGDGVNFVKTLTSLNKVPSQGNIIIVGFYGTALSIGHGSMGGWEEFGLDRIVTKSDHNKLYELNEQNALELYKKYLGDYSKDLPGSALLFPLSMKVKYSDRRIIRTVLAIDNDKQSMIFAGNLPEGNTVRLMRADFDKLIDASATAAKESLEVMRSNQQDLTLMISCVGRKIVLESRLWEEVKNAENILGNKSKISGFYSYGGISPLLKGTSCELHNQTMTITTFSEAV